MPFVLLMPWVQISKTYTHYAATILFFFFGFKTLYDTFLGEEVRLPLQLFRVSAAFPGRMCTTPLTVCPSTRLCTWRHPRFRALVALVKSHIIAAKVWID